MEKLNLCLHFKRMNEPLLLEIELSEVGKRKQCNKHPSLGVPGVVQWLTNPTRNHEVAGSTPGLAPWIKDPALP